MFAWQKEKPAGKDWQIGAASLGGQLGRVGGVGTAHLLHHLLLLNKHLLDLLHLLVQLIQVHLQQRTNRINVLFTFQLTEQEVLRYNITLLNIIYSGRFRFSVPMFDLLNRAGTLNFVGWDFPPARLHLGLLRPPWCSSPCSAFLKAERDDKGREQATKAGWPLHCVARPC